MKFAFYAIGLLLGFGFGFFPGVLKPKPLFSKIVAVFFITLTTFLALYPPSVATLQDLVLVKNIPNAVKKLNVVVEPNWNTFSESTQSVALWSNNQQQEIILLAETPEVLQELKVIKGSVEKVLVTAYAGNTHLDFYISKVHGEVPWLKLPYILGLEERARILYFHVPMSWVGFLAYIVTLVCAIMYLRTSENTWDILAQTSAAIGTLFCSLAYLTGALWAKFNWGHFFNWDTREISVLVMLLIYAAYFALRSSIENEEQRKRLSSVYAILACIAAGFLMWILPRMLAGLHPGSGGEATAGPMISPQADTLNNTKAFIFSLSLSGFTMIYFWILNLSARITTIKQRVQPHTA